MISNRALNIEPFYAMEILEYAQTLENQGKDIIHLEVGEPDFDTPLIIKETAKKELDFGNTHYTHSLGIEHLRNAIANFYKKKYNVNISPNRVLVTNGSSPALFLSFAGILDPGDNIILSNPSYPCYKNIIRFLGGELNYVNVFEEENFQFPISEVKNKINNRTKAIMINSPSNPTGTLLSENNLKDLASIGKLIISDEIYHGLVYGEEKAHSILEYTDNAIVINGFSKLYAMTGWRLGYLICPENLIRPLQKIQQNFFISANSFVQEAGIVALEQTEQDVSKMRDIYSKRRKVILEKLTEMGFNIKSVPNGAFYIFLNVKKFSQNSLDFAKKILEKANVGVTPGIDFGSNGEGFIRICYANSMENILELTGKLSLSELAALLSRVDLFISNDSGPMHLSASVNTPTLGIFGPSLPEKYAPIGQKHAYYKNTSKCDRCLLTECDKDFWCLKNTKPETILKISLELLDFKGSIS
jgi:aspartate/methionine/tyrosine aminotransferase